MTIFGWDASDFDWSRGSMDLVAARKAGIDFFTHKSTEGTSVTHNHYGEAMRRARDAGVPILGAYHVVRSPANASAEVDFWLKTVTAATPWWKDFPCWFWQIDLEKWPYDAVPASEGENVADIIEQRTNRPSVIYASQVQYENGLAGTSHPLWNANYPYNRANEDFKAAYSRAGGDNGRGWVTYSGKLPIFWQYSSTTKIGSQSNCDANAFRGSLAELQALLNGDNMALDDATIKAWGGAISTSWQSDAAIMNGWDNAPGGGPKHWLVAQVKLMIGLLQTVAETTGVSKQQLQAFNDQLTKLEEEVGQVDEQVLQALGTQALADPAKVAEILKVILKDQADAVFRAGLGQ